MSQLRRGATDEEETAIAGTKRAGKRNGGNSDREDAVELGSVKVDKGVRTICTGLSV